MKVLRFPGASALEGKLGLVLRGDHDDGERVHSFVSLACVRGHNVFWLCSQTNVEIQRDAEGVAVSFFLRMMFRAPQWGVKHGCDVRRTQYTAQ